MWLYYNGENLEIKYKIWKNVKLIILCQYAKIYQR